MNQTNVPAKDRSCFKCGYHGETSETICPRCKRPLQPSSSIRFRGALLVLCGAILMGLIGYISLWALNAVSGARFTGTHQEKLIIFGLFAVLTLFGFVSFAAGLWQLVLGRRSRIFVWAVVVIGSLVAIGGGAIIGF